MPSNKIHTLNISPTRCKCVCPNPSVVNATHTERKLYIKNVPPRYNCHHLNVSCHHCLEQPLQLSKRGDSGGGSLRDRHRCILSKMRLQVSLLIIIHLCIINLLTMNISIILLSSSVYFDVIILERPD